MSGEEGIIFSEDIAYLPGIQAAVIHSDIVSPKGKAKPGPKTPAKEATEPKVFDLRSVGNVAYWGDDNLFPQTIIKLAEASTELPSLLDWKARAAQGTEVLPYTRVWNPVTKKLEDELIQDPEILSFFTAPTTKRYYRQAYTDFFWFWNVFPDLIKSRDGEKIAYIGTHDASWCRWKKMDENGVIPGAVIASNWGAGYQSDSPYWLDMACLNPYNWNIVEDLKANTELKRFIYPINYPSPGKAYYSLATWDGIRTSGWLALAASIPAFKQAIMTNQMHIKYLIRIPTNYWASVYENWEGLSQDVKAQHKKDKLKQINDSLTGAVNAGKSILNEVGYDLNMEKLPGWDIEVIDDKLKDGAYIEDSQEASSHLLRALGLDGTLVGQGPGRNLNAGGGSDKLIAFNMYCALQEPYRDVVNEPIYFIARYNGWMDKYPLFKVKTTEAEPQMLPVPKKVNTQQQDSNPQADAINNDN